MLLFASLVRGSINNPSIFGIEKCSFLDWGTMVMYVIVCIMIVCCAIRQVSWEQEIRIKYGRGLEAGDIELKPSNILILIIGSIFGGFASGALGMGGGLVFNPLLLSMGVPAKVASHSGIYMVIFASGASTFMYGVAGML